MRSRRVLLSITAGLITPFPLFFSGPDHTISSVAAGLITVFLGSFDLHPVALFYTLTILAFAIAVSLWEPISPLLYATTLILVFSLFFPGYLLLRYAEGNLTGLVAVVSAAFGLMLGALVAAVGPFLHKLRLPMWVPLGIIAITFVGSATVPVLINEGNWIDPTKLARDLEAISRSEFTYAASTAQHAFTCNGPDLPGLAGIQWRPGNEPESTEKNEASMDGYQISLHCGPPERPKVFSITWVSRSGDGGVITADSEGHISRRPTSDTRNR